MFEDRREGSENVKEVLARGIVWRILLLVGVRLRGVVESFKESIDEDLSAVNMQSILVLCQNTSLISSEVVSCWRAAVLITETL
jgi:hypothetical protein